MKEDVVKRLLGMKEKLERDKEDLLRRQGRREEIIRRLKTEFGITPEQIKAKLKELEGVVEKIEKEIDDTVLQLRDKYGIEI